MNFPTTLVFSANKFFIPYLSAFISSILDHSSSSNFYKFIIVHSGLPTEYQSRLEKQILCFNTDLEFVDVTKRIKQFNFYTENRKMLTEETYYRLFIPYLLPEYDKAIYLDGDMIALTDVAELNKIELGNHLVGAVRDYCGLAEACDPKTGRKDYIESELGLKCWSEYYIAGLLVMNLKEIRKEFSLNYLLDLTLAKKWTFHDQDIINVIAQNRVKPLDPRWNVLQNHGKHRMLPDKYYQEWKRSIKDPWIIHYGGNLKPWCCPRVIQGKYFWMYASKSPFYKEIKQQKDQWSDCREENKIKYYSQYLLPIGSPSREFIKTLVNRFKIEK